MQLGIISCCAAKRAYPCAARQLYVSDLFVKKMAYLESHGFAWVILSAKMGLVLPADVIEPYDLTLSLLDKAALQRWRSGAAAQLTAHIKAFRISGLINLTSATYWQGLEALLPAGLPISQPLIGMPIGVQLQWLKANTQRQAAGFFT